MNAAPRPCPERELLLHGLADGELDAGHALQLEEHLKTCSACAAAFEDILAQKKLFRERHLRSRASLAMRERMWNALAAEDLAARPGAQAPARVKLPGRFSRARVSLAVSAMALAASLMLFVSVQDRGSPLNEELVAGHVRSLLASHLTDVASSDQHTVKPWFLGKLDFSPPVIDLAQRDFPLIGGRLDYIGGREVAALIYKRRGHVINLFIWPARKNEEETLTRDGYHIAAWTKAGFTFAAVSDLNPAELAEFQEALAARL